MALTTDATTDTNDGAHHTDGQQSFIDRVSAQYDAEDAKHAEAEDGVGDDAGDDEGDETDEGEDDAGDDDTDGTEEDPEAGTSSDDSDGSADESEEGSSDDDEAEHPDDEEESSEDDSEEGGDADDDDEAGEEEGDEEDVSDSTKAALTAKGADLTLEDVPKEYRGIVEKKLKGIDTVFGRVMQEQTAFRAERAKVQAEDKFRAENPALAIVEMIQAGGDDLFEKVNEHLEKLADETQAEAFKIVVKDKRSAATKAIDDAAKADEAIDRRADEVVEYATTKAKALNLPWRRAEKAVETALLRKPENARDLTNAEIDAALKEESDEFSKEDRERRRTASKDVVKRRTVARKVAPPATRTPAAAASPRPAAKKPAKVDHDSEESRHAAMMRTARRVAPGKKDK